MPGPVSKPVMKPKLLNTQSRRRLPVRDPATEPSSSPALDRGRCGPAAVQGQCGTAQGGARLAQGETLQSLVHRARLGDQQAFSLLWNQHEAGIRGLFARSLTVDEAEDLTQEVAIAALRSIHSLSRAESFPSWLGAIARNRLADALSQNLVPPPVLRPLHEAMELPAPATGTPMDAAEILAEVHNLPDCHIEPLLLKLVHGLSGPEIATRTGMTPGSVRVNLCRGMKLLRQRLKSWRP